MARIRRETEREEPPPRWPIYSILLVALVVRLIGIGYGLPYPLEAEEERVVEQGFHYTAYLKAPELLPQDPQRPALPAYLSAAESGAVFGLGNLFGRIGSLGEFREFFLTRPTLFYVLGRLLSTALGLLCVWMVYVICRRVFEWGAAVMAAGAFALAPPAVHFSQLATGEMLALAFSLLAAHQLIVLVDEKRVGSALAAAVLAGLSAGAVYEYAVFALPVVVVTLVVLPREYKVTAAVFGVLLVVLCLVFGLGLAVGVQVFRSPWGTARGFVEAIAYGVRPLSIFRPALAAPALRRVSRFAVFDSGIGPGMLGAGLLGLIWGAGFEKYRRKLFLTPVLFFAVGALFLFPADRGAFWRWTLVMWPPLALGAGALIYRLFWRRRVPAVVAYVLMSIFAVAAAGQALAQTGVWALRDSADDTRVRFARWARREIPNGSTLLATPGARYLLESHELGGGRFLKERGPRISDAWGGEYTVHVFPPVSVDDWMPGAADVEYLAVDNWSLERIEAIHSHPPLLEVILLRLPSIQGGLTELNQGAARFIETGRDIRAGGERVKYFPEPPPGLGGYGPGIEVFRVPAEEPDAPPAGGQAGRGSRPGTPEGAREEAAPEGVPPAASADSDEAGEREGTSPAAEASEEPSAPAEGAAPQE